MNKQATEIPNFVTHYSRGEPFQSLSGASSERIQSLDVKKVWGLQRLKDPEYLPRRIQTEKLLKRKFQEIGGRPVLEYPVYFFLGSNLQFQSHPLNKAFMLSLENIPSDSISFTYGDSLLSFDQKYKGLSADRYQNPLCEIVFKKESLKKLFTHSSYPVSSPLHVEAQLWERPSPEWTAYRASI